jgi:hypothetical protein
MRGVAQLSSLIMDQLAAISQADRAHSAKRRASCGQRWGILGSLPRRLPHSYLQNDAAFSPAKSHAPVRALS